MYKKILLIFGKDTRPLQYHILFMSLVASVMGTIVVMIIKDSPAHLEGGVFRPMYIFGFILVLVTFAVSRHSGLMGGVKLSEKVMERMRLKIANQIRQAELPQVENLDMANIYVVMSRGSRSNQNGARAAVHTLQSSFIVFFCIGYLLWYSPVAALGCILCISLVLAIYKFYYRHVLYREMYETYEMERRLFDSMNHFFEGFKELKLNASKSADLYENHLAPVALDTEFLRIKIEKRFSDNSISCNAIFFLLLAGVIFVQARFESPDRILQIATIIIFLWTPLQTLNLSMPHIAEAFVALDRNAQLERHLNFNGNIGQTAHDPAHETLKSFKSIDLEGVCFSHSDKDGNRNFSIGPIHLSVRAGEILFIMGGNGSGKSTLIKVLCGLYPPEEGQFFIDGQPADITDYRYLFSAVFSDFHLFEKLYGVDDVDDTKVKALLDLMELSRSTQWRGDRFTKLDLSTGQRKRLALIGTLLENKPVLLFDEWAAEQAPHFRKYFYETLLPDFKAAGKAVVVITHDDRFSYVADRVIKLERGRHATVLTNNPADTVVQSCPK